MNFNMTPKVRDLTGSRKKQFGFDTREKLSTNSYWDGGSRDEFTVMNLSNGKRFTPPSGVYPFTTPNVYELQLGDIVIETGTFCGKKATPRFYCLPADEARVKQFLGIA